MASGHISLPGSSKVVAVSYKGAAPDIRRARLVREKQSRETADRMERSQSTNLDASAWADAHRAQVRGHNRQVRRGGTTNTEEHPFIAEVRQAAREQKGQEVTDWLEEQEPEPEPEEGTTGRVTQTLSGIFTSAKEAIGASWPPQQQKHLLPTRGGIPKRNRFPANSLHNLLPEDWGQGKRQRAINRYKKDLRQAEEELQQLHFREQPGGLADTAKQPGHAEPSDADDLVWQYYADIINAGDYSPDGTKPWTGSYAAALAKSRTRIIAAGDEHSSGSDEELIAAIPNTYFKPVECAEEETPSTKSVFFADMGDTFDGRATSILSGEQTKASPLRTPISLYRTPEYRKPKLLVNSLGHKTTAPTKAQLRATAAREPWEQDAERRKLLLVEQSEGTLW